jgi:CBS domain-containing protein
MKVREIMSDDVRIANPDDSIARAAQMMEEIDAGVLPVGENDRLVGMITDRDIAIRAVGKSLDPQATRVRDVMTAEVKYCYEDEELDDIAENMADLQVRRLPVLNRQKRLIGIVSVGDIATGHKPVKAGVALRGIAEPSAQHNQSAAYAGTKPSRHS